MTTRWGLLCYRALVAEYPTEQAARRAGAHHIRACPEGPMPWATQVQWHRSSRGRLAAAARSEWLDHQLINNSPAQDPHRCPPSIGALLGSTGR